MKKNFFLVIIFFAALLIGLVYSCKKDSTINPPNDCPPENGTPTDIGIKTSFTEEFENFYQISTKGWVIKDNSPSGNSGVSALWGQGQFGTDKGGVWHGFTAFSYTTSRDEYAYSSVSASSQVYKVSSWLITPVLSVKNGDKISFYTRSDTTGSYTERMQVLMNKSASENTGTYASSVCSFSSVLLDINSAQAVSGYPTTWTRYEYTFSGISGKTDTRIAFRHYVANTTNAKGIGIDQFKFEVN